MQLICLQFYTQVEVLSWCISTLHTGNTVQLIYLQFYAQVTLWS